MKNEEPEHPGPQAVTVHQRLAKVAEHCAYIRKDGINQFHKYSYATAAQIFEKVGEALQEHGLVSIPQFSLVSREVRTNSKGSTESLVTVQCALTISGNGEIVTQAYGSGLDNGDKAIMKAQTAALKYAWMMLLNISTGDDPEADATVDARMEGQSIKSKQVAAPRLIAPPRALYTSPEPPEQDPGEEEYPDSEHPAVFDSSSPNGGMVTILVPSVPVGTPQESDEPAPALGNPGDTSGTIGYEYVPGECSICKSSLIRRMSKEKKSKDGKSMVPGYPYETCELAHLIFIKDPVGLRVLAQKESEEPGWGKLRHDWRKVGKGE